MATQQSGLVSGNRQNTPGGNTPRNRSKFPLSYSEFQTERFAEYAPFFIEEGVSGDVLPLHSNHEVQTYTLKSPILQSLSKKSDFFVVPMQAILPLNWEKFYTNPNIGQDVPADCGLGVVNFWQKMKNLFDDSWTYVRADLANSSSDEVSVQNLLRFLIFFENIYSCGSLMETLRISGHNWFKCDKSDTTNPLQFTSVTYDEMFDSLIGVIQTSLSQQEFITFTLGGNTYRIASNPLDLARSSVQDITLREALELMRDDLSFVVTVVTDSNLVTNLDTESNLFTPNLPASDAPLNLGRLWAYQLVVSHFYSNDHVDFIYSADLYRQYIQQLVSGQTTAGTAETCLRFQVNGLWYLYDSLSAKYFDSTVSFFTSGIFSRTPGGTNNPSLVEMYSYFLSLFSFKRSLRFLDYFTGSRAYPLAQITNGANLAPVSGGAVDVVDLSRSSMMTRFLQAVNRSGRKFSNYMRELFGKTPAYDYHNPMYLAHVSDLVGAQETDNTGQAQVTDKIAVTSRFRATSSRYAFEFRPDRDCIVIGITYYDLPRVYSRATDAQNFYINRFDMFNPYLQFIGDQGISEAEIGTDSPNVGSNFSYTNRNMEYKQRFNGCSGGFCVPSTQLDHWIFPADTLQRKFFRNISPSFIRSFNSEIDRFYQSLSGYSLGTYYHFIVRYDNRQDASRPMAYNPIINV